jgi:hypothetical protein
MKIAIVGPGRLARALVHRWPYDVHVVGIVCHHSPALPAATSSSTDPAAAAGAAVTLPVVQPVMSSRRRPR